MDQKLAGMKLSLLKNGLGSILVVIADVRGLFIFAKLRTYIATVASSGIVRLIAPSTYKT